MVARSTSLSDPAFRALRSQKRAGESDSDVVLRLVREANRKMRDPMKFFRKPPEPAWPADQEKKIREKMRQEDIDRMRGSHGRHEG